ncbi:MAG: hypothetical protein IJA10_05475 [Lachnospiraceae bacterium]|nr:hypothetical protein [Lachnospiraceae bacterium]
MGIQAFFQRKKKKNGKKEVIEESLEKDSKKDAKKESKEESASSSNEVNDLCEQVIDASYHGEDLKKEYQLVTDYLTDIQKIEEYLLVSPKELEDIARRYLSLQNIRQELKVNSAKMQDKDIRMMKQYEKEIETVLNTMVDAEKQSILVKKDMKYLEGEKDALEFQMEQETLFMERMKKTGFYICIVMVLLLAIVGSLMAFYELDLGILLILVVLAGAGGIVYTYHKFLQSRTQYNIFISKMNKAIGLLNKVKIKCVNCTNTLEYMYEKYQVKDARELDYIIRQYDRMKKDELSYRVNTSDLNLAAEELEVLLKKIHVKDSSVWTKQAEAILNPKEMVEVKHSLNVRRQKLRDQMEANEQLIQLSKEKLREIVKETPALEEEIREQLFAYHLEY